MLRVISFFALFAISVGVPQYPPSGWRPRGTPFVLPREYLPSAPLKAAVQHEINRERLEYIGQYQVREPFFGVRNNVEQPQPQLQNQFNQNQPQFEPQQQVQLNSQFQPQPKPHTTYLAPNQLESQQQVQLNSQSQPQAKPHTTYLTPNPDIPTTTEQYVDDFSTTTDYYDITTTETPTTENFLRVQGLPSLEKPAQFRDVNKKVTPLNKNNFVQQQSTVKNGQLRQQPQSELQQVRQQQGLKGQITLLNTETAKSGKQVANQISNTYGAPQITTSPVILNPANTYGVPQGTNEPNDETLNQKSPANENKDKSDNNESGESNESNEESNEQVNDGSQANIAVSNAVNTNGQYYILSPDNMLQRVVFMTTPNHQDSGFTAQLKYMPVEPIRDPIYAYNENGQLIRILRK